MLLPGQPIRKETPQGDRAACGWLFSPFDRFSKLALLELLGGSLDVHRLKGVFNVGTEWLLFNRVEGDLTCESIPTAATAAWKSSSTNPASIGMSLKSRC